MPVENKYQAVGRGLRQTGADVGAFADKLSANEKMKALLEDMIVKRAQTMASMREQERQAKWDDWKHEAQQEDRKRGHDALEKMFTPKVTRTPTQDARPPMPSPEQMQSLELDPQNPVPPAPSGAMPPAPAAPAMPGAEGVMPEMPVTGTAARPDFGLDPVTISQDRDLPEKLRIALQGGLITGAQYFQALEQLRTEPPIDPLMHQRFQYEFLPAAQQHLSRLKGDPTAVNDILQAGAALGLSSFKPFEDYMNNLQGEPPPRPVAPPKPPTPRTAGGVAVKPLTSSELDKLNKIRTTASDLKDISDLAETISSLKRGPMVGWASGKNPYDADIARLENFIIAAVPGMARGIFGEVGVLTDTDMDRYMRLLANIRKDPSVAKAITDDLQTKIGRAWPRALDIFRAGGRDVASFRKGMDFDQLADVNTSAYADDSAAGPNGSPPPETPTGLTPEEEAELEALEREFGGGQ